MIVTIPINDSDSEIILIRIIAVALQTLRRIWSDKPSLLSRRGAYIELAQVARTPSTWFDKARPGRKYVSATTRIIMTSTLSISSGGGLKDYSFWT